MFGDIITRLPRPYYRESGVTMYSGDCRKMAELADNSVHCVVTSPPYWGLRKYKIQDLVWGKADCEHEWGKITVKKQTPQRDHDATGNFGDTRGTEPSRIGMSFETSQGQFCLKCQAWKGQLGLEPDPSLYVCNAGGRNIIFEYGRHLLWKWLRN